MQVDQAGAAAVLQWRKGYRKAKMASPHHHHPSLSGVLSCACPLARFACRAQAGSDRVWALNSFATAIDSLSTKRSPRSAGRRWTPVRFRHRAPPSLSTPGRLLRCRRLASRCSLLLKHVFGRRRTFRRDGGQQSDGKGRLGAAGDLIKELDWSKCNHVVSAEPWPSDLSIIFRSFVIVLARVVSRHKQSRNRLYKKRTPSSSLNILETRRSRQVMVPVQRRCNNYGTDTMVQTQALEVGRIAPILFPPIIGHVPEKIVSSSLILKPHTASPLAWIFRHNDEGGVSAWQCGSGCKCPRCECCDPTPSCLQRPALTLS